MKLTNLKYLIILPAMVLVFSSCYKMRIEVHHIPSNTPTNADIYITGEFNNWDPGDINYRLEQLGDSAYFIDLPRGFGEMEYKFTRGDWTTVEKDNCGYEKDNRIVTYGEGESLVKNTVESWADLEPVDCDRVTIVLSSLPGNTPPDAFFQLAGNITNWDIVEDEYIFNYDEKLEKHVLNVFRPSDYDVVIYKITRGSLTKSEADGLGRDIQPRTFRYGETDTIFVEVKSWADMVAAKGEMITLIVDQIPDNTPDDETIFFVGEINDWYPHDNNLRLEKNRQGQYFINLPKVAYNTQYKFTRGSWNSVEKDAYGYEIDNRILSQEKQSDTIRVSIWKWADLSVPLGGELSILVFNVPAKTSPDDKIYITGNFNNWNPSDPEWELRTLRNAYYITIPRQGNMLEFKFTRGSWESVEVDASGQDIPNRSYRWGDVERIEAKIVKWKDRP